jgi:hypothetical protein
MGQIGGILGTEPKKTSSVFETAAGSILGGLLKKASSPQGTKDVFGAVEKTDDSILDKLGDLLGGGEATEKVQEQGSGILDMVLGGQKETSGLVGMISKALGLDDSVVGKLLTMAAPIVMGIIARHVKAKAMDAVGLGNLLGEQKSHVASALPNTLASNFGLGDFTGKANEALGAANNAASNAATAAGDAAAQAGGGLLKLIVPLGIIAAIAVGGWWYMNQGPTKMEAPDVPQVEMPKLDFANIPGMDALGEKGKTLSTGFTELADGIKGVSDVDGAKGLVGKIEGFTGKLDGLGLDGLEGPAASATSGMVGQFVDLVKKLLAGKSVDIQTVLQPAIDALMKKLNPLAG